MLQDGDFVLLLDGELHLPDLKRLLEVFRLLLQVLPPLLLLPARIVTLVQVTPQVLNLLLLLPEDLPELVGGMAHVLQHVAEFGHRLTRLVEDLPPRLVVHGQLVDLLPRRVDVPLVAFDLLKDVLRF